MMLVQTIHVSLNGNDDAEGTASHPFATIGRAQQAARQAVSEGTSAHVLIHSGVYYLTEPLQFTQEDSGTQDAPVIYEAMQGEEVIISGGMELQLEWVPYKDQMM